MKRTSLRSCIDQNCKECIYDRLAAGTWRQQVTLCAIKKCPLWEVRPKSATLPLPDAGIGQKMAEKGQSEGMQVNLLVVSGGRVG